MLCHTQSFGNIPPTGLVQISWEKCLIRCCLLQILEIFTFRPQDDVQFQSGSVLSLGVSLESKSLFFGHGGKRGD